MKRMLPPGQRAINYFPRFGFPAYASRLPAGRTELELVLGGENIEPITLRLQELSSLSRKKIVADFHCVTTWTKRDLQWEGWGVRDIYDAFIAPRASLAPGAGYLELVALDGYRTSLVLSDALADNVIIADRLQGETLTLEHGAPLRLVAPDLYGYKNPKHICRIDLRSQFRPGFAERQTRAHPRGRVAYEERGRGLPGWAYRLIYRTLFPPTVWYYRRVDRTRRMKEREHTIR
jgi:DMSO/TMAO reductase YedYZ molybdopterin-dependent catalytic subunit